jgi:GT2 family glycosyltransferase
MQAVVVLYRLAPGESPALLSLQAARNADPQLSACISLLVWDNTPCDLPTPQDLGGQYHHDPSNPGLAAAYNAALQQAGEQGCQWLLLLDQDTTVTASYLHEALSVATATPADALVPRLVHGTTVVSPFYPAAQGPVRPIAHTLRGISAHPLQAFNSGSILRVSAMQALGGFDTAFPLDYLDHATFAALQNKGSRIHVLDAELRHDLSTNTHAALDDNALRRQVDILAAESRFVTKYGSPHQRRMMPIRMLRYALSVVFHKRDMRHALLILKMAVAGTR